jgi:hypothetical protein
MMSMNLLDSLMMMKGWGCLFDCPRVNFDCFRVNCVGIYMAPCLYCDCVCYQSKVTSVCLEGILTATQGLGTFAASVFTCSPRKQAFLWTSTPKILLSHLLWSFPSVIDELTLISSHSVLASCFCSCLWLLPHSKSFLTLSRWKERRWNSLLKCCQTGV